MAYISGNDCYGWRENPYSLSPFAIHKRVKGSACDDVAIKRRFHGGIPIINNVQRIIVKRNNMEMKTNTLILILNTPDKVS